LPARRLSRRAEEQPAILTHRIRDGILRMAPIAALIHVHIVCATIRLEGVREMTIRHALMQPLTTEYEEFALVLQNIADAFVQQVTQVIVRTGQKRRKLGHLRWIE